MNDNAINQDDNGYSIADLLDIQASNISSERSKAVGTQIGQSINKIDLSTLKKAVDTPNLVKKAQNVNDVIAGSDKTRVKTIDIPVDFDPLATGEKTKINSLEYSSTYIDVDGVKSGDDSLEILNPNKSLKNKEDTVIIYDDTEIMTPKNNTDNGYSASVGAGMKRKGGIAKSSITVNRQSVNDITDAVRGVGIDSILDNQFGGIEENNSNRPPEADGDTTADVSVSEEEVEQLFDMGAVIPEIHVPEFDSSEFDSEFDELTASIELALNEVENIRTRLTNI